MAEIMSKGTSGAYFSFLSLKLLLLRRLAENLNLGLDFRGVSASIFKQQSSEPKAEKEFS
jgi:hypothetical protein